MKHWYIKPHHDLKDAVRTILVMEGFSEPTPYALPVFTNGMPMLLCRTERDPDGLERVTRLSLLTQSTDAQDWNMGEATTVIAYFFSPFVMPALFNVPVKRFSRGAVDLCDWQPHMATAIQTQLIYSATTSRKIDVLDNLLLQQRNENEKVCTIIRLTTDLILNDNGTDVLSAILGKLNITERTLQRIFNKYVGVTPTQYRRICQFQLSLGQLRSRQFEKVSDVAFDNGFADQSHFIRAFKEFTRVTPNDYLKKGLPNESS